MNILSIGGSDPSSGAGIQSDIKAAVSLGVNCFSVVTAVTAQNSVGFFGTEIISPKTVALQLDSVLSDFAMDAVSIGMVYDSKTMQVIHSKLKKLEAPIIVDPVVRSTTGGILMKKSAVASFKKTMVPLAHTITPNVKEAELFSGIAIRSFDDLSKAAKRLVGFGAKNVIITGHTFANNKISDFVYENGKQHSISARKLAGTVHGSGCNFAFALAYSIAQKKPLLESAKFAKEFVYRAIKSSQRVGHGIKITEPTDTILVELDSAIKEFQSLKNVFSLIPEVQTNFVFSKQNPKSLNDIAGVSGRIVRSGKNVLVAGDLEYGGSRHVASAVFTMQKKFPQIRSALNIKFDEKLIKKFQRQNTVSNYDRTQEPPKSKLKEGSSISWGIHHAIKKSKSPPDVVYHKGDYGKEPMIIVFGKTPRDVVSKIANIL